MESVKHIITVLMESAVDINAVKIGEAGEVVQTAVKVKPEPSIAKNYSIRIVFFLNICYYFI